MKNTELYYHSAAKFIRTFGQKNYPITSKVPTTVLNLRGDLIDEEHNEYVKARKENNLIEQLDGLCDLLYVTAGTLFTCGLQVIPWSSPPKQATTVTARLSNLIADTVDECYQPRPCHQRMYNACNNLLIALDKIGAAEFNIVGAFKAVHANNMNKLWKEKPTDSTLIAIYKGPNQWLIKNTAGKIIKPPGHEKPKLGEFIK